MDGNIAGQQDDILYWLKDLEEKSFINEKKIYTLVEDNLKIRSPKDLTPSNCIKLFNLLNEKSIEQNEDKKDLIQNGENSAYEYVFYIFRDSRFYMALGVNQNNIKKFSYTISRNKIRKEGIYIKIEEEITGGNNELFQKISEQIWKMWEKKINTQIDQYNENREDNKITGNNLFEIVLEENDLKEEKCKLRLVDKEVEWSKESALSFVKVLDKKVREKYPDFYILPKNDYYIVENDKSNDIDEICNAFSKNVLKATEKMKTLYSKEKKDEKFINTMYQQMINFLESNKTKIKLALESDEGKELLLGAKTLEKLTGNFMEFLLGVLIPIDFTDDFKENRFVGNVQTKSGLTAVDNIIRENGFQCKNFPARIFSNTISIYDDVLTIALKDNSSTRIFTSDEKRNLFIKSAIYQKTFKGQYRDAILALLKKAFPLAIRYEQRESDLETGDKNKEEVLNSLKGITNTFYFLNFYLIPSSRIFYELREQLKMEIQEAKEDESNSTLLENFYEAVPIEGKQENKNYFESLKNKKLGNIFEVKKFNLFFKGITFDFKSIKGKVENGNILSR